MKSEVSAIKHTDVRGKEQLYLKINNGTESHVINIGKATYDKLNKLSDEQQEDTLLKIWNLTPNAPTEIPKGTDTAKIETKTIKTK